jgi:hypothetical protein
MIGVDLAVYEIIWPQCSPKPTLDAANAQHPGSVERVCDSRLPDFVGDPVEFVNSAGVHSAIHAEPSGLRGTGRSGNKLNWIASCLVVVSSIFQSFPLQLLCRAAQRIDNQKGGLLGVRPRLFFCRGYSRQPHVEVDHGLWTEVCDVGVVMKSDADLPIRRRHNEEPEFVEAQLVRDGVVSDGPGRQGRPFDIKTHFQSSLLIVHIASCFAAIERSTSYCRSVRKPRSVQ